LQLSFFFYQFKCHLINVLHQTKKNMKTWLNNSRKLMAAFGAVAIMLVAGWQFGIGRTEAPFSSTDVALEKAIAGSGYCEYWQCVDSSLEPYCVQENGNIKPYAKKKCAVLV